jgi:hypothetical protein
MMFAIEKHFGITSQLLSWIGKAQLELAFASFWVSCTGRW